MSTANQTALAASSAQNDHIGGSAGKALFMVPDDTGVTRKIDQASVFVAGICVPDGTPARFSATMNTPAMNTIG